MLLMTKIEEVSIMEYRTVLTKNGRLLLPVKFRKALDLRPGDELILRLEKDSIQVIPLHQAVAQAQKLVRKYIPEGASLVADLLAVRREEAKNE
jgi:AbrB family looped-hinge helix DNA binding protein